MYSNGFLSACTWNEQHRLRVESALTERCSLFSPKKALTQEVLPRFVPLLKRAQPRVSGLLPKRLAQRLSKHLLEAQ